MRTKKATEEHFPLPMRVLFELGLDERERERERERENSQHHIQGKRKQLPALVKQREHSSQ
jgi:hypothetical protein